MNELKNDLSGCKVGDWIWSICDGWVKITAIVPDTIESYHILTKHQSYTCGGYLSIHDIAPSAFREVPECFKPFAKPKPCEFKKGDRVLVSNNDIDDCLWRRGYYSHTGGERHFCFDSGKDEWSSKGIIKLWNQCKKWEESDEG